MTDARPFWCPEGAHPVNHYGAILGRLWSGLLPPPTDKPCILAIRGLALFADEPHEVVAVPRYDDTGILFIPGSEPFLFPMATHPYQKDSRAATDGNGDGVPDVATVRTGLYRLTLAITKPYPIWTFATMAGSASIPCARDLNHDGKIDWREQERQLSATAILLHVGHDAPAESDHRSSIGCATASLRSLEVVARAGRQVLYRLVTAAEAIEAARFVTADTVPPVSENVS
jgi:hypothetical protein